jgi:peptidoglycan/LPS O-acetylase OafA/YrhL
MSSSGRIPSLDGLRAVSIAAVISTHMIGTRNFVASVPEWWNLAELGVRVFFVISGYLISTLLFADHARVARGATTFGRALGQFYVRRIYRLFPAAYLYVAVIAILTVAGAIQVQPGDLLAAATYTMNYHLPRSWWVGHLWSLSVEEQFYILWPAVVLLAGVRRATIIAVAALVIGPVARLGFYYYGARSTRPLVGEIFPTIFDAIACGCVLAGIRDWLGQQRLYLSLLRMKAFWLVPVAVVGANMLALHPKFDLAIGQTVENIGIALLIDRSIRFPETLWGRFLNTRPMMFVGVLSYSLYLWQQPFVNRHSSSWISAFPVSIALSFVVALASYYFIEQPFLRLRARRVHKSAPATPTGGGSPKI